MLSIGSTTLARDHITEQSAILSLIADKVSGLDIVFGMGSIFSKWYHMIERESSRAIYDIWINRLFAYVAMIAITSNDAPKVYIFSHRSPFACLSPTHRSHKEQSGTWSSAFFSTSRPFLLYAMFVVVAAIHSILFSVILPMLAGTFAPTVFATGCQSIVLALVFPEFTYRLFRLAFIAPLIARLHDRFVTTLAYLLIPMGTISTILTCASITSLRTRDSIKTIDRFFNTALLANLRGNRFMIWRILDSLKPLQPTPFIPTGYTPRLISASLGGLFVKLFEGLFDIATSTFLMRKQRELFNMVQFSHGLHPLLQGVCLVNGDVRSISINEKSFASIIPQYSLKSQFTASPAEKGVL